MNQEPIIESKSKIIKPGFNKVYIKQGIADDQARCTKFF